MIITSSVNHLFANKGFRSNLGFRIHSLSASQTKVQQNPLRIILHGDAAVVSGRWTGTFTHNGKTSSLRERFTNFYARLKGQWRCVASHGSNLP
jgi:ketosteroid isomerase-like protein